MTTVPSAETRRRPLPFQWRQVWILYLREMRAAIRERTIVFNSILIPVFLYPFLLWVALSGIMFVTGQTDSFISRVGVKDWPGEHPGLKRAMDRAEKLQITVYSDTNKMAQLLLEGALDVGLHFVPASGSDGSLSGNFEARVFYDESKDRSVTARTRVTGIVRDYREEWLNRESRTRNIPAAAWDGFSLAFKNVASKKQMGAFIIGLMVPVIFVVMVAVGCFYPAIDAIAGERERGTWETLMSTAASRTSIAAAKYLYVASMGGIAGGLNVTAVLLTMKPIFGQLLAESGKSIEFTVPLAAIPLLAAAATLLAGFIAAGMMVFAAFARTFKEGQAMITPFYLVTLLPVVFLQVPGLKLSLGLALVPIVNITLMLREALGGAINWGPTCVTLLASLSFIAVSVRFAAFVLQYEDIISGNQKGTLFTFIRDRARKPRPSETRT